MLLCHSMPGVTGAGFSTSLAGGGYLGATQDGLYDGIPARVARVQWATTAGTTASWVALTLTFTVASTIRVVGLLGVTLPVGTQVLAKLVNGATVLGTVSQRLRALPPGEATGAWLVFPAAIAGATGLQVLIYNDVNGVASIAANTVFEVGELVAMSATDLRLQADWGIELVDPSEADLTRDSQASVVDREPYRRFEGNLSAGSFDEVYSGGLAGQDWSSLQAAIAADRRCVAIPRWTADGVTVDDDKVAATAVYGRGTIGRFVHQGGDIFTATLAVQESPARSL